MTYAVEVTETARAAIAAAARYLADRADSAEAVERWLRRLWDAVESLERWPRRAARAEEDGCVDFDVFQLVIGRHLLLFTVDDERRTVFVLGLRHGRRRARPSDLPPPP